MGDHGASGWRCHVCLGPRNARGECGPECPQIWGQLRRSDIARLLQDGREVPGLHRRSRLYVEAEAQFATQRDRELLNVQRLQDEAERLLREVRTAQQEVDRLEGMRAWVRSFIDDRAPAERAQSGARTAAMASTQPESEPASTAVSPRAGRL